MVGRGLGARYAGFTIGLASIASLMGYRSALGQGQFVESPVIVLRTFSPSTGTFGWAVADLKDIDSPPDGVTDLIMSAPAVANAVFVYSGRTGALRFQLAPPVGFPSPAFFGQAIADAGDVNSDGVHDILVGASGVQPADPGHAFVFSGLNGALLLSMTGQSAGDLFGYAVAGAGDVNGDGRDDVLVGAPQNATGGAGSGRGYIHSGADGALLRTYEPEAGGDLLGSGTANTGDLNGDGKDDHIVSGIGAGAFGKAYVFSGGDGSLLFSTAADAGGQRYGDFFVAGVGDVNADGTRDVYVGDYGHGGGAGRAYVYSGVDGSVLHTFPGAAGEGVGPGRGAGDVDGDGFADLIVGHYTSSAGSSTAGRAVVYSGQTGLPLRTITSLSTGENFGFDAVGVGDVNGDGLIDYLVSAATQNRVYLISGLTELACTPGLTQPAVAAGVPKNRYLEFTAGTPGRLEAVRITFDALPPPFDAANGRTMWVGDPRATSENPGVVTPSDPPVGPTFQAATLQCSPLFREWSSIGAVAVYDQHIVPSGRYRIDVVDLACDAGDELNFSPAIVVTMSRWGDVVKDCTTNPCGPPDGSVNVTSDVVSVLDKFANRVGAPVKARADLVPAVPDRKIDITDVLAGLSAFTGGAYPFGPLPDPCP